MPLVTKKKASVTAASAGSILALILAFILGRKASKPALEAQEEPSPQNLVPKVSDEPAHEPPTTLSEAIDEVREETAEFIHEFIEDVKPKLRGWLHLWSVPVILLGGFILLILAEETSSRVAAATFIFGAVLTFGFSAVYHRGNGLWSKELHLLFKKLDHSNIFVLIGASGTPFGILLLSGSAEKIFLITLWIGVIVGIIFKVFWINAPRYLGVILYSALGWMPALFVTEFWMGALAIGHEKTIIGFIIAGGIFYSLGAIAYALKKPYGGPVWSFHETFHLLTILAFVCHYVAISVAAYSIG